MNFLDASQDAQAFLVSQLTFIEPTIYRIQYPEIRYPEIVPVDTSAPPWIPSITYFSLDGTGQAAWFNGRANDVAIAEAVRSKFETPVKMAAIGYEYDLEEINQAMMLGRDLTQDKGYYARLASEQFIDKAAIFGDTTAGTSFTGLANNANATVTTAAATGTGSATTFASKTSQLILADINAALGGPAVATSGVEMADTLLLPWSQFNLIASQPFSSTGASEMTILRWVMMNNVYTGRTGVPLRVVPVWGLETAGAGSTARMVAYWRNPAVVKMHLPMPFRFLPPWQDGPMLWKVPGVFRFGGVDVKRPAAFRYVDGV